MSGVDTPGLPFEEPEPPVPAAGARRRRSPSAKTSAKESSTPPYLRSRAEREPESEAVRDAAASPEQPLSVSELTQRIQGLLGRLGRVAVEGEVSRVTRAQSGHVYFDLKDSGAKIACVVWRSQAKRAIGFDLKEGTQVVAHGALDVYAPRGGYSLVIERLEPAGVGALLLKLEQLKRELADRGWFERRRPLPAMPRKVGVVTSRDGAAFRDFLRTRSMRWPAYPVRLAHAPVQGPGSAAEIARALAALDASGVDVIVLCRGGGSLEDLWSFNELAVAEAIWACSVPVVCGVGHETDVTLADHVADHRAHTPTDAAQTVIPDRAELSTRLERAANYLFGALDEHLSRRTERLERLANARALRDPLALSELRERELASLGHRLRAAADSRAAQSAAGLAELARRLESQSPAAQLAERATRLALGGRRLVERGERLLSSRDERVRLAAARLESISPLRVLGRGYSLTTRADSSEPLRRAADVALGDLVETRLADGSLRARVEQISDGGDAPAAS